MDLFEQTGQYEPLTTRLRNILREYKDGVGIFKELIQNADDAGATKVKFLVDWRHGRTESLFSPGMAECQGPALWAYNDAVFTDDDFENINKLAGETKVEDISKIGRFGLGFNAVYHLTDVPSFISREHLVVFDPNTHHLKERHIKDRSRPGIRINLAKQPQSLTRYQDQFQPYNGVFGCITTETREAFHYNGTLFRFPFRTAAQARTSDIIKTSYGRDKIQAIVCSICECASNLLIFSQHVKEVVVFELDKSSQPDEMRLVLSVKKPSVQVFRQEGTNSTEPFIKQCSKWWKQNRDSENICKEFPSSCELVNIETRKEESELSGCDGRYRSDETWFVVSASGTDASLKIARSPEGGTRGFLPCGGAAFVVQKKASKQNSNSDLSGELFCFLPLSISTGLPVHVNGYFAIMSNRVEIWKRSTTGNQPVEVNWNEALMEDALARAYIMLLENLKDSIGKIKDYKFHSLWPSSDTVDMKSWEKLVQKICSVLLDPKTKLFYSDGKWMSINDGFLLNDDFAYINETAVKVLRTVGIHVFNLPNNILRTLTKFDGWRQILHRRTLTFPKFMERYFFPNIKILSPFQRDAIVCFGLDRIFKESSLSATEESDLFKENPCIAVSHDEKILAKPCELVNPFGPAAELFSDQDHRFPVGNILCDANRLHVLEKLGMVNDLDWNEICDRAQSIANCSRARSERSRKLIEYLNKRADQLSNSEYHSIRLQGVKFLPVLKNPLSEYRLSWEGTKIHVGPFCAPKNGFLPREASICGSGCLIVDTSGKTGCGQLHEKVEIILGFASRLPEDRLVIKQLDEAIEYWGKLSAEGKGDMGERFAMESICQDIYRFFDKRADESTGDQSFVNDLGGREWLFLQGTFVRSEKVAYKSSGNGAPFLFTLPPPYIRDYRNLFHRLQIKHSFEVEDYIDALYDQKSAKKENPLTEDELNTAIFFINQINVENPAAKNHIGKIPIPDTDSILRPSQNVVVNLSLWLKDPDNNLKVHEKIPPQIAQALGAKPLKNLILEKFSRRIGYGEAFGQHEELTDRLKGILEGYPVDGILKELVQNADDAQASEIHFIHDTRFLRCKKVATEDGTTPEIQGPALCVYNDRPFSKTDLEGIKNLGIGSKRGSPEMTGRYGIGFNSVYNLTDCPSFLSNDDTLVILDPCRRYVLDEDPGKLFTLNTDQRKDFSDTIKGYLGDHFDLKGSTMFRFPLRRKQNESKISKFCPDLKKLIYSFKREARISLLFLNHVRKISLSKINSKNEIEEIYRVESALSPEAEESCRELARKILDNSDTPTAEIGWDGVSYKMSIKEGNEEVEEWLIQKGIGSITSTSTANRMSPIPDGRKLGLLPRGGVAARLWTRSSSSKKHSAFRGLVFCFLPLPEKCTGLPVHINGHFTVDGARRRLWTDTDGEEEKSKWNRFMLSCVLPPTYAALIMEARSHFCNDEDDDKLSLYHGLFPNVSSTSSWKTLSTELYRYLGRTRAKVLPLLVPTESEKNDAAFFLGEEMSEKADSSESCTSKNFSRAGWLSAYEGYFATSELEENFSHLLIRIGLPVLLHAPYRIYHGFRSARITSNYVSPCSVILFLKEFKSKVSNCAIGNLPKRLEATVVKSIPELSALIGYCSDEDDFGKKLSGLPLLLTQDGCLRVYQPSQPVFRSTFGDLFPTQMQLFLHSEIVHHIPRSATQSKKRVVRNFTVYDLAELLPHVFTKSVLKAINDEETWKLPTEGILSEQWLERFWGFLEDYVKHEPVKNRWMLNCLLKWPVIPTTCGRLVAIKDGKSVLDMTIAGNESPDQRKAREFLLKLNCPVLNKKITFKDSQPSADATIPGGKNSVSSTERGHLERKRAVTDHFVGHPHDAAEILMVLHYMLRKNKLDLSKVDAESIREFLLFLQNNFRETGLLEKHKQIIKDLPIHKTFEGQFVSLVGQYSSRDFISFDVPTQQLDELQMRTGCLFLNSDALPALEDLYKDLGVIVDEDVTQFYVKHVFKNFTMFTRENQMQHLRFIHDEIYPNFPQGGSTKSREFLECMKGTPCIPDEHGQLHFAREFFNPKNKVFQAMFDDERDKFPPSPFGNEGWLLLLEAIGLQVDITPALFLEFCTKVAENGKHFPSNGQNRVQSKSLVKCLFSKTLLPDKRFLSQTFLTKVSQIKFIASEKVEEKLSLIHEQYKSTKNGYPPFTQFRNAVCWSSRFLIWTTAPILPIWAQPDKIANLHNTCSKPSYIDVLEHLKNVAAAYSAELVDADHLDKKITKPIYEFLSASIECDTRGEVYKEIEIRLKDVPCVFLKDHKIFVKAEQLVFKLHDKCDFKPFLYVIPLEFGVFEDLFKRLGATDRPTTFQIAYVLRSIHEQVGDGVLSSDQEMQVKYAMHLLFERLYEGENLHGIDELYLPSQRKCLVKSSQMVCMVSSRYTDSAERLRRPLLMRFEACGLKKAACDYINQLPDQLRPKKFKELVREEVDQESQNGICPKAKDDSVCHFQQRYENLLQSKEFNEGLQRLLIKGRRNPQSFEHIRRLITCVQVKCTGFGMIKINVIRRDTNEVIDELEDSCYAVHREESWILFIQHEFEDDLVSIASCIDAILGECINEKFGLIKMLGCSSPNDISVKLNALGIPQIHSDTADEFDSLDDDLSFRESLYNRECGVPARHEETRVYHGGDYGMNLGVGSGNYHDHDGYAVGYRGDRYHSSYGVIGGNSRTTDKAEDERFFSKDRNEARRWLQQSINDLDGAKWLLQSGAPFNAHACFQSQQVVEKCLKAMFFNFCGISGRSLENHKVLELGEELKKEIGLPDEMVMKWVRIVTGYYLKTRYPNCQPPYVVPAKAFDKREAEEAVEAASKMLHYVEKRLGETLEGSVLH
ncbi:sacsin-like [Dendronephthya gigantea]|uniref:sacsin-like n=1 Tax=Dendronephthya gigantea TaxID=151771 RepID=UPI00106C8C9F|nr:sacsin-like [Dendronephthya gigantea]